MQPRFGTLHPQSRSVQPHRFVRQAHSPFVRTHAQLMRMPGPVPHPHSMQMRPQEHPLLTQPTGLLLHHARSRMQEAGEHPA